MNEEISRQLREAAEAHQPDRGRMLARVQRGMGSATVRRWTPGIARSWPKAALAGLAVAGILATAGLAIAGIVQSAPAVQDNASAPPVPTFPAPTGTPSATQPAPTADDPAPPHTPDRSHQSTTGRPASGTPNSAPPAGSKVSDGPLSSEGSIDPHSHAYWTQCGLTLTTAQPLTTLTVELRIAQTGGVQTAGQWQTGPVTDFTTTVQETDGALVYRWDLKPGHTVPAGQHTFAAQYNHPNGPRDARIDSYRTQATAADGTHTVHGGFTPAR